jgi:opine dehydrogenase
MRIGIAGCGGIGLATAAWLARAGHAVTLWSPRGGDLSALRQGPLQAHGLFEARVPAAVADGPEALGRDAELIVVAVPVNGHRAVADALLPALRDGQTVLVSSMASLSSLYLFERARARGLDVTVASLGTTVLTARREAADRVRVMTCRDRLGVSALPQARTAAAVALCAELFGARFDGHPNALASALTNVNPVAHGPLALFNWTRIERAEHWPQYLHMTPHVAAVIERLDGERLALAQAFGITVRTVEAHFAQSFGATAARLADIAAELHSKRGGPPGPTGVATRFLAEDIPFGLVFALALGRIAGVPMPATRTIVDAASLIAGRDFASANDLLAPLGLADESIEGLWRRLHR